MINNHLIDFGDGIRHRYSEEFLGFMAALFAKCMMNCLLNINRVENQYVVLHNIGMRDTSSGKLRGTNSWILQRETHFD